MSGITTPQSSTAQWIGSTVLLCVCQFISNKIWSFGSHLSPKDSNVQNAAQATFQNMHSSQQAIDAPTSLEDRALTVYNAPQIENPSMLIAPAAKLVGNIATAKLLSNGASAAFEAGAGTAAGAGAAAGGASGAEGILGGIGGKVYATVSQFFYDNMFWTSLLGAAAITYLANKYFQRSGVTVNNYITNNTNVDFTLKLNGVTTTNPPIVEKTIGKDGKTSVSVAIDAEPKKVEAEPVVQSVEKQKLKAQLLSEETVQRNPKLKIFAEQVLKTIREQKALERVKAAPAA